MKLQNFEMKLTNHVSVEALDSAYAPLSWEEFDKATLTGEFSTEISSSEFRALLSRLDGTPPGFTAYLELPDGFRVPLEFVEEAT